VLVMDRAEDEAELIRNEADQLDAGDPLRRMAAYRLALELVEGAWTDAEKVREHQTTSFIASQLYRAASSIGANIAEGYSRSSSKDRVRLFEYALGSARECRFWYHASRFVLDAQDYEKRSFLLTRICKILLTAIPRERGREIRKLSQAGAKS